jgi:phenylacetic acid degradation protein paaN
LYANLITGNNCIAKPHPKAIYPMAIVVEELQKVFVKHQLPATIVQLAPDTIAAPITKELCENPYITLVDYTGGNAFGNYVESLTGKTVFTEKAGVNSVIIDSTNDIQQTAQNLAFSLSLYSGQMCTAPQNIYVAESGIQTPEGTVSFEEFKGILANAITGLANHPKAGAGTLAAIQNDQTLKNIQHQLSNFSEYACKAETIQNPEFENARTQTISLAVSDSSNKENLLKEYFGPFAILVKTKDFDESLQIANESAKQKGAITCLAYCTNEEKMKLIEDTMNKAFTPVSFNLSGAAFVNQHAAFSDFHVTGGNPAGNASFTDPNFVNQRFIWVGNRYMKQ